MEICFVFNIQTKRTIAALLIYFHVGFSWCLVNEYLFVYIIAQSRTIPAQSPFFTAQFTSQNPHIFLFFPAPCQKACLKTHTIFFFFPHPVRRPDVSANSHPKHKKVNTGSGGQELKIKMKLNIVKYYLSATLQENMLCPRLAAFKLLPVTT